MKLIELNRELINSKNKKSKNNLSIIRKITEQDLFNLRDYFDLTIKNNLYYRGWNTLHYACLNPNPKILEQIIKMYVELGIEKEKQILNSKEICFLGDYPLNIVINNNLFNHYVLLLEYNFTKINYCEYDINSKNQLVLKNDELRNIIENCPNPNNLFMNLIKGKHYLNKNFYTLYSLNFDEKIEELKNFIDNVEYFLQYKDEPYMKEYFDYTIDTIINIENKSDISVYFFKIIEKLFKLNCYNQNYNKFWSFVELYIKTKSAEELFQNKEFFIDLKNYYLNNFKQKDVVEFLDKTIRYIDIKRGIKIKNTKIHKI